jgi:hypothetical protein
MSCLACKNSQHFYHYSGSEFGAELNKVVEKGIRLETKGNEYYIDYERIQCSTCGMVWEFRYSYPDHPPMLIFGDAIGVFPLSNENK